MGRDSFLLFCSVRKSKPFGSLFDVANRCDSSKIKKTTYEALIESGAFDSTYPSGVDRSRAYYSIPSILEGNKAGAKANKKVLKGQMSMFGEEVMHRKFEYAECAKWTEDEIYRRERARIGLFLTGHPLNKHKTALSMKNRHTYVDYLNLDNGKEVTFAGIVFDYKPFTTKTGNLMAFLKIEDEFGTFDCVIFAKVFEEVNGYITENQIVLAKGRVKLEKDDEDQVVERKVMINEINDISILYENNSVAVNPYKERIDSIITSNNDGADDNYEEVF